MDRAGLASTLVLLRWFAVLGQSITVGVVAWGLDVELPVGIMFGAIAVLTGFNLFAWQRVRGKAGISDRETFLHSVVDVAVLSFLIACSGGTSNPFTSLFLLPIAFAALALPQRWLFATAVLCGVGYAMSALYGRALPSTFHHLGMDGFDLHMTGMAVNFLISAVVFVYFLARMSAQRWQREQELAQLQSRLARDEGILALATHAAAVAHELNTPLATMQLLLGELMQEPHSDAWQQDVKTLETLVSRCSEQVRELARTAELGKPVSLESVIARWHLIRPDAELVCVPEPMPSVWVDAGVGHLLMVILDNAADASREAGVVRVDLTLNGEQGWLQGEVRDYGQGMDSRVRASLGERFQSSKKQGLGVGLALSHAVVERLGGTLQWQAHAEGGTRVCFRVPMMEVQGDVDARADSGR